MSHCRPGPACARLCTSSTQRTRRTDVHARSTPCSPLSSPPSLSPPSRCPGRSPRTATASASPASARRPQPPSSSSGAEDRGIEVEFEVDQNRNGVPWRVTLRRNGSLVASTTVRTQAPSGSFSLNRVIAGTAGTGTVSLRSRRARAGRPARQPPRCDRTREHDGRGASARWRPCSNQRRPSSTRDVPRVAEQPGRIVERQPARVVGLVVEPELQPASASISQ